MKNESDQIETDSPGECEVLPDDLLRDIAQLKGHSAPQQTVSVTASGAAATFAAVADSPWMTTDIQTGATPAAIAVRADPSGMDPGVYTGSLGYWDPLHRKADLNILIRTVLLGQGRAWWQVGAGIVADSDP